MTTQPISERRLAANRANAQKSTGPRTAEGKRRVAQNACRHNLYSKLHHLPEEIAEILYRRALEETADIADPRFRALFVHRLMLRGHERRLLQLEGKLWAEALRVNNGIVPYASLWIRENHAEVVQALGRYHAWICVRIRAIQKSIFPYIIGDEAHQTGIPARTQTLLASAAGSSRPITLVAYGGTPFSPENQAASTGPWNSIPSTQLDEASSADPAIPTHRNLPPAGGLSSLLTARGGFRPVRPVPAPQAVKAIRPPTVPGLSLRYLNKSRNSAKAPEPAHSEPVRARRRPATFEPVPERKRRATRESRTESSTPKHSAANSVAQSTLREASKPAPAAIPSAEAATNQLSQSTLHEQTKPSSGTTPAPARDPRATSEPVPEPKGRATATSLKESRIQRYIATNPPAQSTLHERTKPSSGTTPAPARDPRATPEPVPERKRRATSAPLTEEHIHQHTATNQPTQSTLPERTKPSAEADLAPAPERQATPEPVPERKRRATAASLMESRIQRYTATNQPTQSTLHERTKPSTEADLAPAPERPATSEPVPERKRRATAASLIESRIQRYIATNPPAQSTLHERTKPTHPSIANPSTQPVRRNHHRIQPRAP